MVRIIAGVTCAFLLSALCPLKADARLLHATPLNYNLIFRQDTVPQGKKKAIDTAAWVNNVSRRNKGIDSLHLKVVALSPNLSLQQMLKGGIAGLYVQETNGEPGTEQSMLIRGLSAPVFKRRDIYAVQPIVYLNGIPLTQDNPFAFDIQKYDYNRIGPATNLLAGIDINNISSIEVIKDPAALALLGPNAANGAIWVTTKQAQTGFRKISVNSYFGMVQAGSANTVNGSFENNFRKPFYQKYATTADYANYAGYLSDSTNTDYYGPSNWNDLYYKTKPIYSVDLSLTGGSDRANFRFFGGATRNAGSADETSLNRYNATFQINMAPFEWLTVSSMVNVVKMDRSRNRSLTDRFAETRYLTDFSSPLSPNKASYGTFLNEYEKAIDENSNNLIQGSLGLTFKLNKVKFTSSLMFDYTEGIRDVFYPSTLMEGNNYVSNYFGFNQRAIWDNAFTYDWKINEDHKIDFRLGQSLQYDTYKYNYANAYNGPNDFIKINLVDRDLDAYNSFYVFRYSDREKSTLASFYGSAKYSYKDLLEFRAVLRNDGTSGGQPDNRWLIAPAASASWNLKNQFLKDHNFFQDLSAQVSYGRSAKLFMDDRFSGGPQYRVEGGSKEEPTIPSYGGQGGVTRPYTSGWVGYGIKLPHTDQFNFTLAGSMLNNRLNASLTWYNKDDKDMVLNIPLPAESGYTSEFRSGLGVRNTGLDVTVSALVIKKERGLNWNTGLNFNINKNKLKSLPGGLKSLIIGDNKLEVGKPIDAFWVYQNQGIYNTNAEVPVNPANNQKLSFDGLDLKAGDAKWKDQNGDYVINQDDKVLTGNRLPVFTGGWSNGFSYGNWDLNFQIFFAVGNKAINKYDASRYDFINQEFTNNINSIKEVTTWQTSSNAKSYPIYNVWSNVIPYRADQDLFLENASYAKLRALSVGYDFSKTKLFTAMKSGISRAYLYVTANNLVTVTSFSGRDPELVDYTGLYTGAGIPIPRTFTLGIKLDL